MRIIATGFLSRLLAQIAFNSAPMAQSSGTGAATGTVTDPSGGADVVGIAIYEDMYTQDEVMYAICS